jgi:hypothetical protein
MPNTPALGAPEAKALQSSQRGVSSRAAYHLALPSSLFNIYITNVGVGMYCQYLSKQDSFVILRYQGGGIWGGN